ncbi:MAG: hypothetical protein KJ804_17925 [Proteobacteria bacterium]|nr:hypothetical protein [Pseudomonadota bacterium]MBU1060187.1 hypothetical protein [Pseudomonadota bacterium]
MIEYWTKLRELFDTDDESIPDIFIAGLSGDQVCTIYSWVMSQAAVYDEPTLWHNGQGKDLPIKSVDHPADAVVSGDVSQFHHGLTDFRIGSVELLGLTIGVYPDQISFDYQTGEDWDVPQVAAFLQFLAGVARLAPAAHISHRFEGADTSTPGFTETVREYIESN